MDTIYAAVLRQLEQSAPRARELGLHASLKDDVGLSSLSVIAALTALCKNLSVDIMALTDADFARLERVGDLVDLFTRHSRERSLP
jgi:acyl carrier protein